MRILIFLSFGIILFLSACKEENKPLQFPTSTVTPAARISALVQQDPFQNTMIEIQVDSLAQPERLTPPQRNYVIWVETKKMGNVNIGKIYPKPAKKSILKTLTPFQPKSIFITAEKSIYINEPEGVEITRLKL